MGVQATKKLSQFEACAKTKLYPWWPDSCLKKDPQDAPPSTPSTTSASTLPLAPTPTLAPPSTPKDMSKFYVSTTDADAAAKRLLQLPTQFDSTDASATDVKTGTDKPAVASDS